MAELVAYTEFVHRIFLLSPASCVGERARQVLNTSAQFDLPRRLRTPAGAPLGKVFSVLSGRYFRGSWCAARGGSLAA